MLAEGGCRMRKNFGVKFWLYPQPVMMIATYNEDGTANAMNAAWGGIADFDKVIIDMSDHKTTDNIARTGAFTVACADTRYVAACDYVGIVSGNEVPDKFSRAGFTATKSAFVNAPIINELSVTLECELLKIEEDGRYIGKIVNVSCDEQYLGEDGLPDLSKFTPITFDPIHDRYIALGETVGQAFSNGKALK